MENFHWKISINSRPLFIMFSHLFGCPKAKESALINVLYLIWSKGHKSLVMRLGPKAPLIKQTQLRKKKIESNPTIFLSINWLFQGQHRAIIEGTGLLTQCSSLHLFKF